MATATCQLNEDQFLCSICLDVFTDPVTLPCGHNFCKNCISRHWSNSVQYKCPYCKQAFYTRTELKVNTFISEMADHFRQSQVSNSSEQQAAKPREVLCDFCPDPKHEAVKSCLVCLASYCEPHLEPHLKVSGLKRHQLIDPQSSLEERVCPEHNKLLELFCKEHQECVCVLCTYSHHKNHEVVPLNEASAEQKLQLEKTEADVQEIIKKRQVKIQELCCSVALSDAAADTEMTNGVKVYTALKEMVEKGLDNLIQEITKKKTSRQEQAKGLIKDLEQEVCELKKMSSELQQLSKSNDDLKILQNLQLSTTPLSIDWDSVSLGQPTFEGTVARALFQLEVDVNETTKKLLEAEMERVKSSEKRVILDSSTAHPNLTVSEDGRNVTHCPEQRRALGSPKRFDELFVLGKKSFSESFYFEVGVSGKTEWTLGVAQKPVNRKGTLTLNPQHGFWTIGLRGELYYASAAPEVQLFTKRKPERVGVFVDFAKDSVCFYDAEAPALLHSFTGFSFKEELYPLCSPGHSSNGNSAPLVICRIKKPMCIQQ